MSFLFSCSPHSASLETLRSNSQTLVNSLRYLYPGAYRTVSYIQGGPLTPNMITDPRFSSFRSQKVLYFLKFIVLESLANLNQVSHRITTYYVLSLCVNHYNYIMYTFHYALVYKMGYKLLFMP